jgi:hypothetical protein
MPDPTNHLPAPLPPADARRCAARRFLSTLVQETLGLPNPPTPQEVRAFLLVHGDELRAMLAHTMPPDATPADTPSPEVPDDATILAALATHPAGAKCWNLANKDLHGRIDSKTLRHRLRGLEAQGRLRREGKVYFPR